jgi:hypothetical protein
MGVWKYQRCQGILAQPPCMMGVRLPNKHKEIFMAKQIKQNLNAEMVKGAKRQQIFVSGMNMEAKQLQLFLAMSVCEAKQASVTVETIRE